MSLSRASTRSLSYPADSNRGFISLSSWLTGLSSASLWEFGTRGTCTQLYSQEYMYIKYVETSDTYTIICTQHVGTLWSIRSLYFQIIIMLFSHFVLFGLRSSLLGPSPCCWHVPPSGPCPTSSGTTIYDLWILGCSTTLRHRLPGSTHWLPRGSTTSLGTAEKNVKKAKELINLLRLTHVQSRVHFRTTKSR